MDLLLEVNTERLLKLADFLETVPPEDFSLTDWRTRMPVDAIRLGPIVFKQGCGFAGCAMGWAAHSGIFPGLRMAYDGDMIYRGASGMSAVCKLLGVTESIGEFLFWESKYADYEPIDPDDVAKRIRRLVKKVESRLARRPENSWIKHREAHSIVA